jgi:hypothetical protein
MDSKELRGLYEAYSEVYVPQEEIEEAVKGADPEMRKASSAERRGGDKRLSPSKGKGYADQQKQQIAYMDKVTKKNKNVVGLVTKEDLDIFDVVLEFLQVEGYAETLEEAEWMMANDLNAEVIDAILEARKSYSATAAKAGKDIGKKGKIFGKIARDAGERYGSAERGKKVAGAILAKLRAKHG